MAYGSTWQKKVYDRSPAWGKDLVSSFYGLFERGSRYGRAFQSALGDISRLEYASNEALRSYQWEHLRSFLTAANVEVSHYNTLFKRHRFSPDGLRNPEELSALPIVDKETVRSLMSDLISRNLKHYAPRWVHTSGTMGKALQFPLSSYCFQREYAFRAQHYSWGKADLKNREPKAFLAGHPVVHQDARKPPFWTHDYANNWLVFSSYHMSEANLPAYIEELEKFSPVLIGGYPSSLCLLAAAKREWGSKKLNVRAIYAASETLFGYQRKIIESAFDCKVFVWYGNTEMCGNIVECEHGGFHGRLEHSFMEVLDENGQPSNEGRLVCTGFGNSAFPLVRYDTGDTVKVSQDQDCTCGRGGLLFESVIGRVEDYIVTPDGRLVGRLDHIFKDAIRVVEAQLVQSDPAELIIRIVRRPDYAHEDECSIVSEARVRLGPDIHLKFEYVPVLQRTSAGKARFVITTVNADEVVGESSPMREVFVSTRQNP